MFNCTGYEHLSQCHSQIMSHHLRRRRSQSSWECKLAEYTHSRGSGYEILKLNRRMIQKITVGRVRGRITVRTVMSGGSENESRLHPALSHIARFLIFDLRDRRAPKKYNQNITKINQPKKSMEVPISKSAHKSRKG